MDGDITRVGALVKAEGSAEVKSRIDTYEKMFTEGDVKQREENYMSQVNTFYDLVTPFIEYAWGGSFHFAPQFEGESFESAVARYEHKVANMLHAQPGMKILDIGCGVGGPARSIARFSGANVVGINNNDYQIKRAKELTAKAKLTNLDFFKCDFMSLSENFEKNSIDGAFAIEAIAHAPDKLVIYKHIYDLLKPGAYFVTAEWCITKHFDANNAAHKESKHLIEKGNGLTDIETDEATKKHFVDAGFELVSARDWAEDACEATPWYHPLVPQLSLKGLAHSRIGQYFTHTLCSTMECIGLAPKGITDVSRILMETSHGLVVGGQTKTFTPMYMLCGRKPLDAK